MADDRQNINNNSSKRITHSPTLELIINGRSIAKKLISRKVFTIGRIAGNDMVVENMAVSRHHAQIEKVDGNFFIQDLESRYGTYVNGHKIIRQQLRDKDKIKLGNKDIVLTYHTSPIKTQHNQFIDTDSYVLPFSKGTFKKLNLLLEVLQTTQLSLNLKVILNEIVHSVMKLTHADRGYILLKDDRGDLALKVSQYRSGEIEQSAPDISWGVVNQVLESGEPRVEGDIQSDQELRTHDSILALKLQSIMCIPLKRTHISEEEEETENVDASGDKSDLIGVIYVDSQQSNKIYTIDDVKILQTLAGYASSAISNARLFQREREKTKQLSNVYFDTVRVLANAIEARDYYTRGHTERVAAMAVVLGQELKWTQEQIFNLKMGAYLHDIGKIGVPDSILNKAASLDDEEYKIMKRHPQIGAKIIKGSTSLDTVEPYLLYHQERYDGSGYPKGFKGEEIPIEGRLLAVVDVFDALTSTRPYRGPIPHDQALDMINKEKGKHFDPKIVDVFLECYENGKIPKVLENLSDEANTRHSLFDDIFSSRG